MRKRGGGLKFWGRKSNFQKIRVGKNIEWQGTLYTPDNLFLPITCSVLGSTKHNEGENDVFLR